MSPQMFTLLFLAIISSSYAQNVTVVEVEEGSPLEVRCGLRVEHAPAWRRDGVLLPGPGRQETRGEEGVAGEGEGEAVVAWLRVTHARPQHAGLYTCADQGAGGSAVRVRVRPAAALHASEVSAAGATETAAEGDTTVVWYDVHRPFVLNCSLPNASNTPIQWYKNGTLVSELSDMKDRYELRQSGASLAVGVVTGKRTTEDDFGNYTCRVNNSSAAFEVRGHPYAKLPLDAVVVEGHALKLVCRVYGKPRAAVTWRFGGEAGNDTDALVTLGDRLTLQTSALGAPDAEFTLKDVVPADAGRYTCFAGTTNSTVTVRVKDMYAALWPFLGICAEVFVLCAIILVYERRRTKPDLEDSDADNHDQKKS